MAALKFDIEAHTDAATLYLRTLLTMADIGELRIACSLLPDRVRRLRIDLRALEVEDVHTQEVLQEVVHYWQRTRGGALELRAAEHALQMEWDAVPVDAALLGVFL